MDKMSDNMSIHKEKSHLAGKHVKIKNLGSILIEDWWDRLTQESWMSMTGNPACLEYAVRISFLNVPLDNEVLYGHTEDGLGHLIHISEIEEEI